MRLRKLLHSLVMPALFLLLSQGISAQSKTVSGKITDQENGAGLPNVSVIVKGSSLGTATDEQGNFSLSVPQSATTLVISAVGYTSREVAIGSGFMDIQLENAATTELNEVVVVGYGTARRRDVTGATATVSAKDFNKGTYASPDQLIQGKAAGVMVINNTGQPGGSTTVRIRGTSSIRSGNSPLFVIDGVPLSGGSARPGSQAGAFGNDGGNPLNYINPNDIANIEILKDASATAIYGSRGANGVVLITTKRGQSGVPSLDVNASVGGSGLLKRLEVLNAQEFRKALDDYNQTTGDFGGDVDAFDAITRTGITQNYNVAMGGGNEDARYRLSAGYLDQEGIIESSRLKKLTANLTSSFKFLPSKKLGLDMNVLVTQTDENIAPVSAFVGFEGNLISQALQWNPTHPLYNSAGEVWVDHGLGNTTINPLAQLKYFDDRAKVLSLIASIAPSYQISNSLTYRFMYSVNRQVGTRRGQVNRLLNIPNIQGRGVAFTGNNEQTNSQITNTLSYNKQVTSDLNINAVVGHEWLVFDNRNNNLGGRDFTNVGLNYYDYLHYSTQNDRFIGSYASPTTELQSYFGRAILNLKDKYLLTATMRADGSTRFGVNNRYGYFPSVGVAWNISQEDFLSGSTALSNLKLRAGWGMTGNENIGNYGFGSSLVTELSAFGNAVRNSQYSNPMLQWEATTQYNIGIDLGLLDDRITMSVDAYLKDTDNLLLRMVLPATFGNMVAGPYANVGRMENKGIELVVSSVNIDKGKLRWSTNANVTINRNTVKELAGAALRENIYWYTGFQNATMTDVGYPVGQFYGYVAEGIFTSKEEIQNHAVQIAGPDGRNLIERTTGVWLGDMKWKDINGDGVINSDDRTVIGDPNPDWTFGLNNTFRYGPFTLDVFVMGTIGGDILNYSRARNEQMVTIFDNQARSVVNRAQTRLKPGGTDVNNIDHVELINPNTNMPRFDNGGENSNHHMSTRWIEDGTFVRIQNLRLGYDVPSSLLSKVGISRVQVYGNIQNLATFTNYSGLDPQIGAFNQSPLMQNVDLGRYPAPRVYTLGLNIDF